MLSVVGNDKRVGAVLPEPISTGKLIACRVLTVFYGLLFPAAFLLVTVAYIFGGFAKENYWDGFFFSYKRLWNGLPGSGQSPDPVMPSPVLGSPDGSSPDRSPQRKLRLAPIVTQTPNESGTAEQQAAYRYQRRALASMWAKFDGTPDGHRCVLRVPCQDRTTQEVRLFFSIDRKSTGEPTEALVNAANPSMVGPAGGINAAIWNLYGGPDGWTKAADFPTGKKKVLVPGEVYFHSGPTEAEDPNVQPAIAVNRPAYVCQALGPNLSSGKPCTTTETQQLESCYENIIKEGWKRCVHSFTFCNISTAIYRFPKEKAAEIAVSTTVQTVQAEAAKMSTARKEPIYIWFAQFSNDSVAYYGNEFTKLKSTP
ncbi:MAG: macro domain-containing protein [Puniceicoccales bacterium]|jgi:O-acetyl-ADP-ribose deacetylase (regulator of RNase III)|nr:macro domain-containing protein [Puniceicoccales bacterium]